MADRGQQAQRPPNEKAKRSGRDRNTDRVPGTINQTGIDIASQLVRTKDEFISSWGIWNGENLGLAIRGKEGRENRNKGIDRNNDHAKPSR